MKHLDLWVIRCVSELVEGISEFYQISCFVDGKVHAMRSGKLTSAGRKIEVHRNLRSPVRMLGSEFWCGRAGSVHEAESACLRTATRPVI